MACRSTAWLPILTALLLQAQGVLHAQANGRDYGIWVTGGLGLGTASISCDACDDGDLGAGPVGTVGLGLVLSHRLYLAAEVTGWFKKAEGLSDRTGFAALSLHYYLLRSRRWFVGGGVGMGRHRTGVRRSGPGSSREGNNLTSPAIRLETGYDLPLGHQFILTPTLSYNRALATEIKQNGEPLGFEATFSVLQFGMNLSWTWSSPPTSVP